MAEAADPGAPHPRPRDATLSPRFAQVPTFMRLPRVEDPRRLDVAIVGVPFDGGVSNRPGARFGPREVRSESALCRPYNPEVGINPFDHLRVADAGDVDTNPISIEDTYERVEAHFEELLQADCVPIAIGGDHSIAYPILRAMARKHGPVNLVHFDSHSDLWDEYFGSRFAHGTMFRRALEDGILRSGGVLQVGIRGQLFDAGDERFGTEHGVETVRIAEALELGPDGLSARWQGLAGGRRLRVARDPGPRAPPAGAAARRCRRGRGLSPLRRRGRHLLPGREPGLRARLPARAAGPRQGGVSGQVAGALASSRAADVMPRRLSLLESQEPTTRR